MKNTFAVEIDYGTCEAIALESGEVVFVWKRNPMGRVNEGILKSIGFLYRNRDEAEAGVAKGATAFVVSVPSREATAAASVNNFPMGLCHAYIVTASHVVHEGYTTLRLTQVHGTVDILKLPTSIRNTYQPSGDAWIWHDEGNDIAVYPLSNFPNQIYNSIYIESFASIASEFGDEKPRINIELGDEVFMPGRLLDLGGSSPPVVVRFGRIAASKAVEVPTNSVMPPQQSYLAELRTDSGFSGAPVLITKPPIGANAGTETVVLKDRIWLLGINWGHLPHYEHVVEMDGKKRSQDWHTQSNSGIANILPSWKLFQVLQYPELQERRREEWEAFKRQHQL